MKAVAVVPLLMLALAGCSPPTRFAYSCSGYQRTVTGDQRQGGLFQRTYVFDSELQSASLWDDKAEKLTSICDGTTTCNVSVRADMVTTDTNGNAATGNFSIDRTTGAYSISSVGMTPKGMSNITGTGRCELTPIPKPAG